jgi:hypothetical protein
MHATERIEILVIMDLRFCPLQVPFHPQVEFHGILRVDLAVVRPFGAPDAFNLLTTLMASQIAAAAAVSGNTNSAGNSLRLPLRPALTPGSGVLSSPAARSLTPHDSLHAMETIDLLRARW